LCINYSWYLFWAKIVCWAKLNINQILSWKYQLSEKYRSKPSRMEFENVWKSLKQVAFSRLIVF
jgi:hypothetical protein